AIIPFSYNLQSSMSDQDDVIIAGGGLAGLCNAISLSRAGLKVHVIEQKSYPVHKVCGEYISNETLPFLQSLQINPDQLNPSKISKLLISSPSGSTIHLPLDLGGFGLSRYTLDHFLYKHALGLGARFTLN